MRQDIDLINNHAIYSARAPWVEIIQTTSGKVVASVNPDRAHPSWLRVRNAKELSEILPVDAKRLAASIWDSWTEYSQGF